MKKYLLFLIILGSVFMPSCEKIEETKATPDLNKVQNMLLEATTAYNIYAKTQEEATKTVFDVENALNTKSGQVVSGNYPQISIMPFNLTDWPKTITVDYGPDNIRGVDGRYRRGILNITANNFSNIENAEWSITFTDYYQNDYKVEGVQTVKYTGLNNSENPEYECIITEGIVTSPAGKVFKFEQQITREWITGYDTHYASQGNIDDLCDDEYLISGTHSGTSSDGYSYTMSTKEPILLNICCKWIMDGILSVNLPDYDLGCEIDYRHDEETGEMCNNQAMFTFLGMSYQVALN